MSHVLGAAGIDHLVLERGEVANSWRTERWDSLRLLTPNWMSRLPGWCYRGDDPDGFMAGAEVIDLLCAYRRISAAPVLTGVTVDRVAVRADGRFDVVADQGRWVADVVVAATGACSEPLVPALADELPAGIEQLTALRYRNPSQLPDRPVLVVGASASGAQIADELQRSGRPVTIAVGEHIRLPRLYRGRDIHWWMDVLGVLDERYDEVEDLNRARRLASLQLVGSPQRRTLDLNALIDAGVRPAGKLMRIVGGVAQFSGGLANLVASADLKQTRLLDRIDEFVVEHGLDVADEPQRPERTRLGHPPIELPLHQFGTVLWATGYRPSFSWLDPAAFDRRRRPCHDGGVGAIPGLFFLGLPFMRRRKSSFIDGVGPDATELLEAIRRHLHRRAG
jgi:putative flavoprotein involved in K+ transport